MTPFIVREEVLRRGDGGGVGEVFVEAGEDLGAEP